MTQQHLKNISYRQIITLSLPVIVANITLPIQGMIDVAIIGHLDSPDYLSAVGVAAQLFALLFVSFNFLQYASSGLSAQALGENDSNKLKRIIWRALLLAAVIGGLLIAGQRIWLVLGEWFFSLSGNVAELLKQYYSVRIWGAGFELANYAFIGWFAGQGRAKQLLFQQLCISVSNVGFNVIFVLIFEWHVVGVALGTVLANALGCAYAVMMVRKCLLERGVNRLGIARQQLMNTTELKKLLSLNRDIMIRTLILTASFAWVARLGLQQGELYLAANVVLLQLLHVAAYGIDGLAVTTESLVGRAYGQKNRPLLQEAVRQTTWVSFGIAGVLSLIFWLIEPIFIALLTDIAAVTTLAKQYYGFAAFIPLAGVLAYQMDGVMFGLTANKIIRNSMVSVAIIYFPLSQFMATTWGNTGVWLAVYAILLLRGGILGWQYRRWVQR